MVSAVTPIGKLLGRMAGPFEGVARAAGFARSSTPGRPARSSASSPPCARCRPTPPTSASRRWRPSSIPITELLEILHAIAGDWIDGHVTLRNAFLVIDVGLGIVRGSLRDGVFTRGFDAVDDRQFTDWLVESGGCSRLAAQSFLVTGWHDFFFAYVAGDTQRPSLSAGSALRTIFRFVFTYKGAFFWKMQAGMGDAVFAPLYLALRRRGVKFEFFHQVKELCIEEGGHLGDRITRIKLARQVDLKDPAHGYDPLIEVRDLACWPSKAALRPRSWSTRPTRLQRQNINLESHWTPWAPVGHRELVVGDDFDLVVLGIPVGALATITPQLCEKSLRWRTMVEKLATNQTFAMQLWFKPTQAEMGWLAQGTVGTVSGNPLNTWADMSQLLVRETWSDMPAPEPKSLVYYCGTLSDARVIPGAWDHAFPREQRARAQGQCVGWLDGNVAGVWPRGVLLEQPSLDCANLKIDLPDGDLVGEQRFVTQYSCVNINPSDRYVLSLPGTASVRIRSDQSGFKNLYCAGDWLATGMNAGCVEGAVMGGLQASQAISGFPERIVGDQDGTPGYFTGVRGDGR